LSKDKLIILIEILIKLQIYKNITKYRHDIHDSSCLTYR